MTTGSDVLMKLSANWIWSDDGDGRGYNLCSIFRRDFRPDRSEVGGGEPLCMHSGIGAAAADQVNRQPGIQLGENLLHPLLHFVNRITTWSFS